MSIPVLERKSQPKMTLHLHYPSKTNAFCSSTTRFLSNSGSLIFLMTTICFAEHVPASVWIWCSSIIAHGLQCLGRYLRLIKVDVDPGSKRTFSSVRYLTEDIVSTTDMLVGVRCFLFGNLIGGDSITSPVSWLSLDKELAWTIWSLLLLSLRCVPLRQWWCCVQTLLPGFSSLGAFPGITGAGLMSFNLNYYLMRKYLPLVHTINLSPKRKPRAC